MPIYTYECQSCGNTLEKRQSFSDDPLTTHETCGGSLRRVIHPAGIVFRGSGFYNTDYKNSTSSTAKDAEPAKAGASSEASTSENGSSSSAPASGSSGSSDASSSKSEASSSSSSSTPAAAPAPTTP